jgi:hypothetical protein
MSSDLEQSSAEDVPLDFLPDLSTFLNGEPEPTFVIPIDALNPISFQIVFRNEAVKKYPDLEPFVLARDKDAVLFRTWALAVASWTQPYDFAGRSWTAFIVGGKWKVIRALVSVPALMAPAHAVKESARPSKPASFAATGVDGLLRMLEMSDIGVFEFDPQGNLTSANVNLHVLGKNLLLDEYDFAYKG